MTSAGQSRDRWGSCLPRCFRALNQLRFEPDYRHVASGDFGVATPISFSFSGGGLWISVAPINQNLRSALTVFSKTGVVLGTEICEFCGVAMLAKLKAFLNDESGATAIEYGLIAAGISIVIIAAVNGIGTKLNTKFASVSTQLK